MERKMLVSDVMGPAQIAMERYLMAKFQSEVDNFVDDLETKAQPVVPEAPRRSVCQRILGAFGGLSSIFNGDAAA
jgi:uncharacterized protein (DUF1499 family)